MGPENHNLNYGHFPKIPNYGGPRDGPAQYAGKEK